jgi:hypothetical protein
MDVQDNLGPSEVAIHVIGRRHSFGLCRISRHDLVYGSILVLIWLAVSLPRLNGPIDLRWDASTYYILGTALAEGKGYRLLNEPGNVEAVQYPPLLPWIVAFHQWIMRTTDYFIVGRALRLTYFLLSGVYLLVIYILARKMLSPMHAFFVGAITGLSFNSFFYPSETLYADLPFALVSILFLLCHRNGDRRAYAIAAGIFACTAYLLRRAGIVLLAAWTIESVIRRRWRQAVIRAAAAAVPIVGWQCYVRHVTHSDEYRNPVYSYQRAPYYYSNVTYSENSSLKNPFQPELGRSNLSDLVTRIARNAIAIPIGLGESCWFGRPLLRYPLAKLSHALPYGSQRVISTLLAMCLVTVGFGALAGGVILTRRGEWFLALYFGLTLGLVMLTPWQSQFWRYLSPIAPLTLIFLTTTLLVIRNALTGRFKPRLPVIQALIGTLLIAMLLVQTAIAVVFLRELLPVSYYSAAGQEQRFRLLTYEPHWHALDGAFEWVRRNGKTNAVVATSVPQLAYLRTQHKAVLPPFEADPNRAIQLLDQVPVSYLIVDDLKRPPISNRYAAPVVSHRPEDWRLAYTAPDGGAKVYERVR